MFPKKNLDGLTLPSHGRLIYTPTIAIVGKIKKLTINTLLGIGI